VSDETPPAGEPTIDDLLEALETVASLKRAFARQEQRIDAIVAQIQFLTEDTSRLRQQITALRLQPPP